HGFAERHARGTALELASEQMGRRRLEARFDGDASRRKPMRQLRRPCWRGDEVTLHRALELECVTVQRALYDLRLRGNRSQELLLECRQRVVGSNHVRRDAAAAV